MDKLKAIMWFIEAFYRLKADRPTFFNTLVILGIVLSAAAVGLWVVERYKIFPLPDFLSWLNDGWIVGFGNGLFITSMLTVKNNSIIHDKEKKLPLTAVKDGLD